MRTITLEIQDEESWESLQDFLSNLAIRVVKEQPTTVEKREIRLQKSLHFWQQKALDFGDFQFDREEANDR